MEIQEGHDLQERFNKLKGWIDGIENDDLVDAEKIYATALFLVATVININSNTSTFTFENMNNRQTGQVYGDYELVIRKLKEDSDGK